MKIGFDAKRAFHNSTGLGNYSRTLIRGLSRFYPEHEYFLFNPKPSALYKPETPLVHEVRPSGIIEKRLPAFWRSRWIMQDIKQREIELYHGLSNEIPVGMRSAGIPSVVTIHDLIFEKYPGQFNRIDVRIYQKKYRYACNNADRIIAISRQTKDDIIELYKVDSSKVDICYQSCDPVFGETIEAAVREDIRNAYELPEAFFLSVGSVIERKNLLHICKALHQLSGRMDLPLVVIGRGGEYLRKVKEYINANGLAAKVIFLSEHPEVLDFPLRNTRVMAAIYQMATALVYPSLYEGFGIPVLEALWSRTPVITSAGSCLPEAGGPGSLYVDPTSSESIAAALQQLYDDETRRQQMIATGWAHAQQFSLQDTTAALVQVYNKTVEHD